jgi:Protein of unknown function (DUF3631)
VTTTPINGDALLNDINTAIKKFCILPGEHEYVAATLWCAYTHFADSFHYAPRLIARSPHKRSGKTRLLEIVAELVRGPLRSVNMTTSSMFRLIDAEQSVTIILDEVDALFGTKAQAASNEDLRALINAGFQRGNPVYRTVGQGTDAAPQPFECFAPAAMAGIGRLPDTIEDRSIVISMRRKAPHETVQPYRPSRDSPDLRELHGRIAEWAEGASAKAEDFANRQCVHLPVDDRAADVWEPLLIVAAVAGGGWLKAGKAACKAMVARADEDDTDVSPGQLLLADIRQLWSTDFVESIEFMASMELCAELRKLQESPWGDEGLTVHRLGRMLGGYSIKSRKSADRKRRGYYFGDFSDAWSRYLPPLLPEKASKASKASGTGSDQGKHADTSVDVDASHASTDGTEPSTENEASRQSSRSDGTRDTSDASDAFSGKGGVCPDCDRPLQRTGKCGACIVKRHNAAAQQHDEPTDEEAA